MKKSFLIFVTCMLISSALLVLPVQADSVVDKLISLPDGAHPYDVAVDSIHHKAYVVTLSPDKLYVIDTVTDSIITSIGLASPCYGVAVDSSKNKVYLSVYDQNSIAVLDGDTYLFTNTIAGLYRPQVMITDEQRNRLYVTNDLNPFNSSVSVIDTLDETIVNSIPTGAGPFGLAVNSMADRLYISSSGYNSGLQIVDTTDDSLVAFIPLESSIQSVGIDVYLNRIFVVNQFAGNVYVIDAITNEIITVVGLDPNYGLSPIGLVVDSELHKAYIGNHSGSNIGASVSVIDTSSNQLSQSISVGPSLGGSRNVVYLDLDTELNKIYAALHNASAIAVIVESNQPPQADPGGPYNCYKGVPCQFNGSASYDNDSNDTIENYEWDFDYDGIIFTADLSGGSIAEPYFTYNEDPSSKTIALRVMDSRGALSLIKTANVSIRYQFNGFSQPVDNQPATNIVNAGRGIPVKFSLSGDQGLSIFALNYPVSSNVTCGNTAEDSIEETVTAGSSSLSYSPSTDLYTFVWKTEKSWAGTCRTLVMQFKDGTFHRANFRFMK